MNTAEFGSNPDVRFPRIEILHRGFPQRKLRDNRNEENQKAMMNRCPVGLAASTNPVSTKVLGSILLPLSWLHGFHSWPQALTENRDSSSRVPANRESSSHLVLAEFLSWKTAEIIEFGPNPDAVSAKRDSSSRVPTKRGS